MSTDRFCRSCHSPRPKAAIRCPWCRIPYTAAPRLPEHLYSDTAGELRRSSLRAEERE
ncbi:MAG: hypothetical protein ACTHLT_17830 [Devosia sp.]|jgi:hypothetical protein